eukprot:10533961-Heterocapsa_arctica.AAC.1
MEPKSRRKHVGSCSGLCPSDVSAPSFLGIHSRRSVFAPSTMARTHTPLCAACMACPSRCALKLVPKRKTS